MLERFFDYISLAMLMCLSKDNMFSNVNKTEKMRFQSFNFSFEPFR